MNKRQDVVYNDVDFNETIAYRSLFNSKIDKLKANNKFTEFENRTEDLSNILSLAMNKTNTHILIVGRTQDGKTYVLIKTIHNIINASLIPLTNIFIITGLSSKDWVEQMKDRTPDILHANIFHRQDLKKKFVNKIKEIGKNIIINIDEAHIASSFKNTISQVFKELKLDDKQYLYENNILIIEYTATPNGNIIDLDNTKKDNYSFYKLTKLPEYTGIEDLINQGRVIQYKDLYLSNLQEIISNFDKPKKNNVIIDDIIDPDKINDIETSFKQLTNEYLTNNETIYNYEDIEYLLNELDVPERYTELLIRHYYNLIEIYKNIFTIKDVVDAYGEPSYVLIRTKTANKQDITIQLVKQIFKEDDTNFITYDRESYITTDILKIKPTKTTIIFIKEMLRCSITLDKRYISVFYDRHSFLSHDDTALQGLAIGRSSGYDDTGKYIIFGDIDSAKKYIELYNANFGDNSIIWNSNTTTTANKTTKSSGTYNNDECIKTGAKLKNKRDYNVYFKECKTYQEAQDFVNSIAIVPHKIRDRHKDANGYYKTTIHNATKPRTIGDVKEYAKHKLTTQINNANRSNRSSNEVIEPCYKDLNDINSLIWLVIYK
jgi:hypothetical protein